MFVGSEYIKFSEVKAYNVHGVSPIAGTWNIRALNTVVSTAAIGSLDGDGVMLLSPGVYNCTLICSTYMININQVALYNITDQKFEFSGPQYSCRNDSYHPGNNTTAVGLIVCPKPTRFYLLHYATYGRNFGFASSIAAAYDNTYAIAEFWKIR